MDIKQIHELVKLVNKSNIGELMIEKEGFKITIKQKKEPAQIVGQPMIQPVQAVQQPVAPGTFRSSRKSRRKKVRDCKRRESSYHKKSDDRDFLSSGRSR